MKAGLSGPPSWANAILPINSKLIPPTHPPPSQNRVVQGAWEETRSQNWKNPQQAQVRASVCSTELRPQSPQEPTQLLPAHVFPGCSPGPWNPDAKSGAFGARQTTGRGTQSTHFLCRRCGPPPPSSKSRGCLRGLHQNPHGPRSPGSSVKTAPPPTRRTSCPCPQPTRASRTLILRSARSQRHREPQGSNKEREAQRGSAFANVTQHVTAPKTPGARALDRSGTQPLSMPPSHPRFSEVGSCPRNPVPGSFKFPEPVP